MLWVVVVFAVFGVVALIASVWDDLLTDPLLRNTTLIVAAPAVVVVAIVTVIASRSAQGSKPGVTAAVGALGMLGVVAASIFAGLAVVVASFIAFVLTCGVAGRLGP